MHDVPRETVETDRVTACVLVDRSVSQVWVMIAGARLAYEVTGHLRPGGLVDDEAALRRRRPPAVYPSVPVRDLLASGATTIHPSTTQQRLPRALRAYLTPSKEQP